MSDEGVRRSGGLKAGFFGKLPSYGDFVGQGLDEVFVKAWDAWVRGVMHGSREAMGGAWDASYLTSPLWRFVLSPGTCQNVRPMVGVLMPSVDQHSRHFPFTIAAELPGECSTLEALSASTGWFEVAEDLALSLLEHAPWQDEVQQRVEALGRPHPTSASAAPTPPEIDGLCLQGLPAADLPAFAEPLLRFLVPLALGAHSLWARAATEADDDAVVLCSGMPDAAGFCALVSGSWDYAAHRWLSLHCEPVAEAEPAAYPFEAAATADPSEGPSRQGRSAESVTQHPADNAHDIAVPPGFDSNEDDQITALLIPPELSEPPPDHRAPAATGQQHAAPVHAVAAQPHKPAQDAASAGVEVAPADSRPGHALAASTERSVDRSAASEREYQRPGAATPGSDEGERGADDKGPPQSGDDSPPTWLDAEAAELATNDYPKAGARAGAEAESDDSAGLLAHAPAGDDALPDLAAPPLQPDEGSMRQTLPDEAASDEVPEWLQGPADDLGDVGAGDEARGADSEPPREEGVTDTRRSR